MKPVDSKDIWLSVIEISNILNKKPITIRVNCKKGKYTTRLVDGNGGKQYRILLSSLPLKAQLKYHKTNKGLAITEPGGVAGEYKKEQEETALARASLVCLYIDRTRGTGKESIIKKKKSFLRAYNNGTIKELYEKIGSVSFATIERWTRIYLSCNKNYLSLIPKYKPKTPFITSEQAEVLLKYALHPNKPKISEIIRSTIAELELRGIYPIYKPITYRRHLERWKKENFEIWTFYREGNKAFNDKCLPSIQRDYDVIEPGDIIVADGHTLNFEIINPYTGKPKRMTMILFYDMKSNMPLGFEIMPTENTMAIAVALRRSILMLGKIPKVVYLDNGKAFTSKFFRGVNLETDKIVGLFERLGIRTIFAKPYHAQSKTIERHFGSFSELERMMPTYCGTSIQTQPPRMNRGEKLHRAVYEKMVDVNNYTIFTAYKAIAWWFDKYANRKQQDGHLKGRTPMEVFLPGKGPGIDKKELMFLMLSQEVKTIYANGIRFFKTFYWHEALFGYRKKVLIKYDFLERDSIFVFDIKTGRFICEARRTDKIHPAAEILGTAEDVKKLRNSLAVINRLQKSVKQPFRKFVQEEIIPSSIRQLESANILSIEGGTMKFGTPEETKDRKRANEIREVEKAIELLGYGNEEPEEEEEEELILWENEFINKQRRQI